MVLLFRLISILKVMQEFIILLNNRNHSML